MQDDVEMALNGAGKPKAFTLVEGTRTYGGNALEHRPEFATAIACITTSWSNVEALLGGTLALMMHADLQATMIILDRMKGASDRTQLLRKISSSLLEGDDKTSFQQLLVRFDALASRRNEIIHGIWGYDVTRPNEICLIGPALVSSFLAHISSLKTAEAIEFSKRFNDQAAFWDLPSLQSLHQDIDQLSVDIMQDYQTRLTLRAGGTEIRD